MKNKGKFEFLLPKGYLQGEMLDPGCSYFKEGVCFLM